MNKIIFLDIDGTLNSRKYITKVDFLFDDPQYQIDPEAVERLNAITSLTGASIVVSSTWRHAFYELNPPGNFVRGKPVLKRFNLKELQDCMASYNIEAFVLDATTYPDIGRSSEIRLWLEEHHIDLVTGEYVILDDEILEGFEGHTVRTIFEDGLQDSHVRKAVTILGYK